MPAIHLFEDDGSGQLHPFHLLHGVTGIRFGAWTQQERWDRVAVEMNARPDCPEYDIHINARWVPDASTAERLCEIGPDHQWETGGTLLVRTGSGKGEYKGGTDGGVPPVLLTHANVLFTGLGSQIARDIAVLKEVWRAEPWTAPVTTAVFGPTSDVLVAPGATVRAASIDTGDGAVVIGPDAMVEPGAHLKGPLIVCGGSTIRMGARVSGPTVIGPECKVGGEISNVNFQGWANKAHDGFLGNSVIGRWCNLGAGTESSNLKNTYGEVRQWNAVSGRLEGSGLQFCGLLMGDHSKCGIGTTFNTGTVVDPACVIFDAGFPPKHLPAFSWCNARTGALEVQDLDRMLSTAERVMARRHVTLGEEERARLTQLHAGSRP